jgi:hypothetical protein
MMLVVSALLSSAHAEDGKEALKAAANSPTVKEELNGPDGCSVQLGDPENWKLICIGTGSYDFNDTDNIKDATQVATLEAKAAISKFLNEKISSQESIDKIVTKQASQNSGKDRKVAMTSMQTQMSSIKSSSDAIIQGVIVLESEQIWHGKTGTVRVKVGQSQKTMALASKFAKENAKAGAGKGDGGNGNGVESSLEHTSRKSDSDF